MVANKMGARAFVLRGHSRSFGQSSFLHLRHCSMARKTMIQTRMRATAMTQPKSCRPQLLNAWPISSVVMTCFGETRVSKDN